MQLINLNSEELTKIALTQNEGTLSANGALTVYTGERTGRSPKDRFIVQDDVTTDTVNWGTINQPFDSEKFDLLWQKVTHYFAEKAPFISHLRVGADTKYSVTVTVKTEHAWQNLFTQNLFIRETTLQDGAWTLMCAPNYQAAPDVDGTNSNAAVILNFSKKRILICGTHYAGEMKKAMFSVLNFLLPEIDVLPMHCAANVGKTGDTALFFGLSGTGKTTLSADPDRYLIGDDEHGWSQNGVFNFEGGCYAKCIDLSEKREPIIWNAIKQGAIMENVVLNKTSKQPDFSDDSFTQNTRAAYPREHITLRVEDNQAGHPNAVLFLTCDLFGVLPPVSQLTKEQAAYHFLSGYTALVGSTEVGQSEGIKTTFSTCFGAPFFPRPAAAYAKLLMKRIEETGATVYLVNTGWTGGAYGDGGSRFAIPTTRAIVKATLSGEVNKAEKALLPGFNLHIPTTLTGIDSTILNPSKTWKDLNAYYKTLNNLVALFQDNFKHFDVQSDIAAAGPERV